MIGFIKQHKTIVIYLVFLLLIVAVISWIYFYFSSKHEESVLMTQEQIKIANELKDKLDISMNNANMLKKEIEKANNKPPEIRYIVQAATVEEAAKQEEKRIEEGTSPANQIPAHKTIVTPNIKEQKVDVYRITLDKARLGVNALVLVGGDKNAEVGIGPSWKNKDNAVNLGITSESRYYGMLTHYF